MLNLVLSNQMKKDLKLAKRRGYDINALKEIVDKLANREALPKKNRDHSLSGILSGFRECHIQPNWLLVYKVDEDEVILFLFRTGTHSDLF